MNLAGKRIVATRLAVVVAACGAENSVSLVSDTRRIYICWSAARTRALPRGVRTDQASCNNFRPWATRVALI